MKKSKKKLKKKSDVIDIYNCNKAMSHSNIGYSSEKAY